MFYHLLCNDETPDTWTQIEKTPSIITEDTPEVIVFELRWWDLKEGIPPLQAGFDVKLSLLMDELL
jgi:hypothetical protein